jgi:hypothetical protein
MPRGRFRRESKGKLSLKHIKFHGNGRLSFKIIICDHGFRSDRPTEYRCQCGPHPFADGLATLSSGEWRYHPEPIRFDRRYNMVWLGMSSEAGGWQNVGRRSESVIAWLSGTDAGASSCAHGRSLRRAGFLVLIPLGSAQAEPHDGQTKRAVAVLNNRNFTAMISRRNWQ